MSTVRLLRSGQLTLPAKVRQALGLKEGAFLDTKVEDNKIVLTPQKLVEQDKAKESFFKVVEKVWEKNRNVDPQEVEKLVNEAVRKVRAKKRK